MTYSIIRYHVTVRVGLYKERIMMKVTTQWTVVQYRPTLHVTQAVLFSSQLCLMAAADRWCSLSTCGPVLRAKGSVMLVGCSCCGELRQSAVNGCRMQLRELDGKLGEARIHAHTGT